MADKLESRRRQQRLWVSAVRQIQRENVVAFQRALQQPVHRQGTDRDVENTPDDQEFIDRSPITGGMADGNEHDFGDFGQESSRDESSGDERNLPVDDGDDGDGPPSEHGSSGDESDEVDSSDNSDDEADRVASSLKVWVQQYNVSLVAVSALLRNLRINAPSLLSLPATATSLLNTPKDSIETRIVSGMDYYYFGFRYHIKHFLEHFKITDGEMILQVVLNTDGSPLFKSSKRSIWPLLCYVTNLPRPVVFPVTITCGLSKPTDHEYLMEGIDELITGINEGIEISPEQKVYLKLKYIVGDSPARCFMKNTKAVTGYHGCDRCTQRGITFERRRIFPQADAPRRTDNSFRNKTQPEHHHQGDSPFLNVPGLDMVFGFPICTMHQVYLCLVRRLFGLWREGNIDVRLKEPYYSQAMRRIRLISKSFTSDFPRKPRDFDELAYLKATELRDLLIYCCPIALHGCLKDDMYYNFLTLCVGIVLLSSEHGREERLIQYAHRLLVTFFMDAGRLYGQQFLVYSTHCVVHLSDEVRQLGESLDQFGAWPFENYLQIEKRQVRSGKNPVVQIVNRTVERFASGYYSPAPRVTGLTAKEPNHCYLLLNGECCQITAITDDVVTCRVFETEPAFTEPCSSKLIGIHRSYPGRFAIRHINRDQFVTRCINFELDGALYFLSLHHHLNI